MFTALGGEAASEAVQSGRFRPNFFSTLFPTRFPVIPHVSSTFWAKYVDEED
jgi:hypothetical protein